MKGTGSCATGYIGGETSTACWRDSAGVDRAFRVCCVPATDPWPSTVPRTASRICDNCIATACVEQCSPDSDCCAMRGTGGCAEGFVGGETSEDCWQGKAFRVCCVPKGDPWPAAVNKTVAPASCPASNNQSIPTTNGLSINGAKSSTAAMDEGSSTQFSLRFHGTEASAQVRCKASSNSTLRLDCIAGVLSSITVPLPDSCSALLVPNSGAIAINVTAVEDVGNRGSSFAGVVCTCVSGCGASAVQEASISFHITNIVRPIIGGVAVLEGSTWRPLLVTGRGYLEIITSKSMLVRLDAPSALPMPVFIPPLQVLLVDAVRGRTYSLSIHNETEQTVMVTFPSFPDVCQNQSICFMGLEIRNAQSPQAAKIGRGGVFQCPGNFYHPDSSCFGALYAVRTPVSVTRMSGTRWHTVRYVEKCRTGSYSDAGSASCSSKNPDEREKCAFGQGDVCRVCPVGAYCPGMCSASFVHAPVISPTRRWLAS